MKPHNRVLWLPVYASMRLLISRIREHFKAHNARVHFERNRTDNSGKLQLGDMKTKDYKTDKRK
jgi:hypothetical protein